MATISAHITPNPHTLKFVVDRLILDYGSVDFSSPDKGDTSPLVKALFQIDGVVAVLVGTNFVSVTKSSQVDWTTLAAPVTDCLSRQLDAGDLLIDPAMVTGHAGQASDGDMVTRIREIIDQEIRPAVAMDGGDILFESYQDGVVMLRLQGACSSCPSSTLTLKMGIENRLREEFPEIRDVIQV